MPVVGGHEEHTAMLRIVIAVRARRVARYRRRSVCAFPGLDLRDIAVARAGERQRGRLLHEIARADPAFARLRLLDHRVDRTGVYEDEPHGDQVHAANAATALLSFEHVRMHRARPGDRRKLSGGSRGKDDCGHEDRENPHVHLIIASVAKGTGPRTWRGRSLAAS